MKIVNARRIMTFMFILGFSPLVDAAPWYTGPLLAPSGKTVALGHFDFEMYGFSTTTTSVFDHRGKKLNVPKLSTLQGNPLLTYGLADNVDIQLSIPFTKNRFLGKTAEHIGDTSLLLGFQVLTQKPGSIPPDLKITLQEIFPTGRFDSLNPTDKGVGATGAGSYQSAINFNFQELTAFSDVHYLRTRLSLTYLYSFAHTINGSSAIGGSLDTHGVDRPGSLISADLAGELSITQHWVGVMEMYYLQHQAGSFKGTLGFDEEGLLAKIGQPKIELLSIAPAIEYNFSEHYGIIGGVWMAVSGKNAPEFTSAVIAFNVYW